MQIPEAGTEHQPDASVMSKIGRTEIQIDQDVIASALEYHRPFAHTVNYPHLQLLMRRIVMTSGVTS